MMVDAAKNKRKGGSCGGNNKEAWPVGTAEVPVLGGLCSTLPYLCSLTIRTTGNMPGGPTRGLGMVGDGGRRISCAT